MSTWNDFVSINSTPLGGLIDIIIIIFIIGIIVYVWKTTPKSYQTGGQKGGTDRPYLFASIFSVLGLVVIAALIYTIILSSSGKLGHST